MPDDRNIIDYGLKSYPAETPRRPWYSLDPGFVKVVAVGILILFLAAIVIPAFNPPRHGNLKNVKCMAQLRQLGQWAQLYVKDHGTYPDSLATLAMSGYSKQFDAIICCPATTAKPATMPTTQAAIAVTTNPASCSYIYLPPTTQPTPNQVLLMDRTAVHTGGKFAIAFLGDGSVRTITAAQHQKILQQINAGQTNIILPP